jgi:hypothetical protein
MTMAVRLQNKAASPEKRRKKLEKTEKPERRN